MATETLDVFISIEPGDNSISSNIYKDQPQIVQRKEVVKQIKAPWSVPKKYVFKKTFCNKWQLHLDHFMKLFVFEKKTAFYWQQQTPRNVATNSHVKQILKVNKSPSVYVIIYRSIFI